MSIYSDLAAGIPGSFSELLDDTAGYARSAFSAWVRPQAVKSIFKIAQTTLLNAGGLALKTAVATKTVVTVIPLVILGSVQEIKKGEALDSIDSIATTTVRLVCPSIPQLTGKPESTNSNVASTYAKWLRPTFACAIDAHNHYISWRNKTVEHFCLDYVHQHEQVVYFRATDLSMWSILVTITDLYKLPLREVCIVIMILSRPITRFTSAVFSRIVPSYTSLEATQIQTKRVNNMLKSGRKTHLPVAIARAIKLGVNTLSTAASRDREEKRVNKGPTKNPDNPHPHAQAAAERRENSKIVDDFVRYLIENWGEHFNNRHEYQMSYGAAARGQNGTRFDVTLHDAATYAHTIENVVKPKDVLVACDVICNMNSQQIADFFCGTPACAVITIGQKHSIYSSGPDSDTVVSYDGLSLVTSMADQNGITKYYSSAGNWSEVQSVRFHSIEFTSSEFNNRLYHYSSRPITSVFLVIGHNCPSGKVINVLLKMYTYRGNSSVALGNPHRATYFCTPLTTLIDLVFEYDDVELLSTLELSDTLQIDLNGKTSNLHTIGENVVYDYTNTDAGRTFYQIETRSSGLSNDDRITFVHYDLGGLFLTAFNVSLQYFSAEITWAKNLGIASADGSLNRQGESGKHMHHLGGSDNNYTKFAVMKALAMSLTRTPVAHTVSLKDTFTQSFMATHSNPSDGAPPPKTLFMIMNMGQMAVQPTKSVADIVDSLDVRWESPHLKITDNEKALFGFGVLRDLSLTVPNPLNKDLSYIRVQQLAIQAREFGDAFGLYLRQPPGKNVHDLGRHMLTDDDLVLTSVAEMEEIMKAKGKVHLFEEAMDWTDNSDVPEGMSFNHYAHSLYLDPITSSFVLVNNFKSHIKRDKIASFKSHVKLDNTEGKAPRLVNAMFDGFPSAAQTSMRVAHSINCKFKGSTGDNIPCVVGGKTPLQVKMVMERLLCPFSDNTHLEITTSGIELGNSGIKVRGLPIQTVKDDNRSDAVSSHRGHVDTFLRWLTCFKVDDLTLTKVVTLMDLSFAHAASFTPLVLSIDFSKFDGSQGLSYLTTFYFLMTKVFGESTGAVITEFQNMLRTGSTKVGGVMPDGTKTEFLHFFDWGNPSGTQYTTLDNNVANIMVHYTAWNYFLTDLFDLLDTCKTDDSLKSYQLKKLRKNLNHFSMCCVVKLSVSSGDDGAASILPFKYVKLASDFHGYTVKLECDSTIPSVGTDISGIDNPFPTQITSQVVFLCSEIAVTHSVVRKTLDVLLDNSDTSSLFVIPDEGALVEVTPPVAHAGEAYSPASLLYDRCSLLRVARNLTVTSMQPGPLVFIAKAIGAFVAQVTRFGAVPVVYDIMICYVIIYLSLEKEKDLDAAGAKISTLLNTKSSSRAHNVVNYNYRDILARDLESVTSCSFMDALLITTVKYCKNREAKMARDSTDSPRPHTGLDRSLFCPEGIDEPGNHDYGDLALQGINEHNFVERSKSLLDSAAVNGPSFASDSSILAFLGDDFHVFSNEVAFLDAADQGNKNIWKYPSGIKSEPFLIHENNPDIQRVLDNRLLECLEKQVQLKKTKLKTDEAGIDKSGGAVPEHLQRPGRNAPGTSPLLVVKAPNRSGSQSSSDSGITKHKSKGTPHGNGGSGSSTPELSKLT